MPRFLIFFTALCSNGFSQVVINEVMVRPLDAAGDLLSDCMDPSLGAEWIEIFNSSLCDTVDLGCYMLASRTADSNQVTFAFPANTRIAPLDFLLVGGTGVPSVDFIVADQCLSQNFCGTNRSFLNNDYGWLALYDPDGGVVDAVYWTQSSGQPAQLLTNPAYSGKPCVPLSCPADSLRQAAGMTVGAEIKYAGRAPAADLSLFRQTDGTGGWLTDGTPTPRSCNGICVTPSTFTMGIDSFENETCLLSNGWAMVVYSGGTPPYDRDWSNGANSVMLTGLAAGCYGVTVTDSLGCRQSDSICLVNIGTPVTISIEPPQETIFRGDSILLTLVTDAILDTILWSPTTGLSCDDCASPIANPTTLTTYTVRIVDADGCVGSATATIAVLSDQNSTFIPTAFTPNEDGWNDLLFVRSPKARSLEFRIFDRWGTEVFATKDIGIGWDGRDKSGREVDAGIYSYYAIIAFENGKSKTLKGNVAVLR